MSAENAAMIAADVPTRNSAAAIPPAAGAANPTVPPAAGAVTPDVPAAPDTTDRITILLNGEPTPLPAGIDLRTLLERLDLADRRLAIEVNGELVPRGRFGGRRLTTHDRVEIIQAVGGG